MGEWSLAAAWLMVIFLLRLPTAEAQTPASVSFTSELMTARFWSVGEQKNYEYKGARLISEDGERFHLYLLGCVFDVGPNTGEEEKLARYAKAIATLGGLVSIEFTFEGRLMNPRRYNITQSLGIPDNP
ncbi:MAG: hypothetical protein ACOYOH_21965, partial [Paracraurococcus sp.]